MKQILDFVPLVLFVVAYKFWGGIYTATAVLMAATVGQMAILYAIDKKLSTMHKVTLCMILGFGALTLYLHDERFIKWKPTFLYSGMALVLAIALWGFGKNLLAKLLGQTLPLPDAQWRVLCVAWICYFVFMASINGVVAAYFSTDFWVEFKLWGYAFPVLFLVGQVLYISKHVKELPEPDESKQA
jgi:intracellular septation protein